jgi:hypothetical protein
MTKVASSMSPSVLANPKSTKPNSPFWASRKATRVATPRGSPKYTAIPNSAASLMARITSTCWASSQGWAAIAGRSIDMPTATKKQAHQQAFEWLDMGLDLKAEASRRQQHPHHEGPKRHRQPGFVHGPGGEKDRQHHHQRKGFAVVLAQQPVEHEGHHIAPGDQHQSDQGDQMHGLLAERDILGGASRSDIRGTIASRGTTARSCIKSTAKAVVPWRVLRSPRSCRSCMTSAVDESASVRPMSRATGQEGA